MDLQAIQNALQAHQLDGWLFCDFHNRDAIAYRILGLDITRFRSRRWFYYIPARGEPVKLVSSVERTSLDALPGQRLIYLSWQQMHEGLKQMLGDARKIAMHYSPMNNIPYVSLVDAGTVEIIRSLGYEPICAADLIQKFEAVIDEKGYQSHVKASKLVQMIKDEAFERIGMSIRHNKPMTEYDIQQFIERRFSEEGLTNDGHSPIVGVNDHPADPHFEPTPQNARVIRPGDTVLIDLWARVNEPETIYYDITWCGYVGENPPAKYVEIFEVVKQARNAARDLVIERFQRQEPVYGWEVDRAAREVIERAGYGPYFIHRTGHSIGVEVHGNGVNMDNLETKDERKLIPGICFSIEPGIYIEGEMAVRSEINVFITLDGKVEIHGDQQEELICIT
ncbi:MAG: M24 family metallopeptidase [Calditrichaeota bacterium]|nr:M24 family metallopeptidase [Calditrichota bacterium]